MYELRFSNNKVYFSPIFEYLKHFILGFYLISLNKHQTFLQIHKKKYKLPRRSISGLLNFILNRFISAGTFGGFPDIIALDVRVHTMAGERV